MLDLKQRGGHLYFIGFHRSLDVLSTFGFRIGKKPISLASSPLVPLAQPTIRDRDAAMVCSATGITPLVVSLARTWQQINPNIAIISSNPDSDLLNSVRNPKALVLIPAITAEDARKTKNEPLLVEDNLDSDFDYGRRRTSSHTKFHLATLLFLEAVTTELYFKLKE